MKAWRKYMQIMKSAVSYVSKKGGNLPPEHHLYQI